VRDFVDEILLVDEEQIARAMAHAYWNERLILEGAGATPIAALMTADRAKFGERIALVLTGNAVDGAVLADIALRHRDAVAPAAQSKAA
jgi:threonine dehydratase